VQAIQTQARSDLMLPRAADWGQCAVLKTTACSDALIFLVQGSYIWEVQSCRVQLCKPHRSHGLVRPWCRNPA
jgi:hypothetical protein